METLIRNFGHDFTSATEIVALALIWADLFLFLLVIAFWRIGTALKRLADKE